MKAPCMSACGHMCKQADCVRPCRARGHQQQGPRHIQSVACFCQRDSHEEGQCLHIARFVVSGLKTVASEGQAASKQNVRVDGNEPAAADVAVRTSTPAPYFPPSFFRQLLNAATCTGESFPVFLVQSVFVSWADPSAKTRARVAQGCEAQT
jgi:hypothetical protein